MNRSAEGVLVIPPGKPRSWVDLLPHPWNRDPAVVLVLLPPDAPIRMNAAEKVAFVSTVIGGKDYGLQIVHPNTPTWSDQAYAFRMSGRRIMEPAYIGKLSTVPTKLLMTDERPVFYLKDNMSGTWMNLRSEAMPPGTPEQRKELWS